MTGPGARTGNAGSPMPRDILTAEHEEFRDTVRTFLQKEFRPNQKRWEKAGMVDRDLWLAAGQQGLIGMEVAAEHGGGGADDIRFSAVVAEELARAGTGWMGFNVANSAVLVYLSELGTEEQKARWLPGCCRGEIVCALAISEPAAGSDIAGLRTTARRVGGDFVLNGQKTFITNGILADLVIVLARTEAPVGTIGAAPPVEGNSFSLLVVERGMPGFTRGRNLDKLGMKAQDTAELFFDDVRVPAANLLGAAGAGFRNVMRHLPRDRMSIAIGAVAATEQVLEDTIGYCRTRHAFARPIARFQHNRFLIAELVTAVATARVFVDRCISEHLAGRLSDADVAMAKLVATETQNRVIDRCLQLHGGYGYMNEYPVARAFVDARVQTIFAGTSEIMKEIISRSLDL